MKFRSDNQYLFGKDMRFFRGIPNGVDFEVIEMNDGNFQLVAPGYGAKENYGNGSLYVWAKQNARLRKRLIKAVKQNRGQDK